MKKMLLVCICILLVILSGCSLGAPSNKDIKEMIYGVYLQEAVIRRKELCDEMDVPGDSPIWLVHFSYKDDNKIYGYLIEEKPDGSLVPFRMPALNITCPE